MKNDNKKEKIWSSKKADDKFRFWIYERDGNRCVLCGRKTPQITITNSHYWGRFASSTRYDPDNCDAICMGCHFKVENAKQGEYRTFKIKQLGEEGYKTLEKRYYQEKITRREAIIKLMKLLK